MKTTFFTLVLLLGHLVVTKAQQNNYWLGAVDNNWSTAGNWSEGHSPTSTDSVHLNVAGDTVILDVDATIKHIVIENNACLNLGDQIMSVLGNWNNTGGLVYQNDGTIRIIGSSLQHVTGNNFFTNLEIDNSNTVNILSGLTTISGVLNVSSGTLNTNNNILIKVDSLGNGSIGPLFGSISGDITVERSFNVNSPDWRFISSPVNNTTYESLNDDMWTSGFPGSTYPTYNFFSVYNYDETLSGSSEIGYVYPTDISDTIQVGAGFLVYMDSGSFSGAIDFTGEVNHGSISLPVTYTDNGDTDADGWNLIGNPMVSAIDWDNNEITKSNLYNAIYIWDPESGTYASYVDGIGANGGSNIISSCQSFWIKASGPNPQLTVPQVAKTNQNSVFFKQSQSTNYLTITLSDWNHSDETIIRANPFTTSEFDGNHDALKMNTTATIPVIYSSMADEGVNYSINQLPEGEHEILLSTIVPVTGTHLMSFEGISNFTNTACVVMEDLFTGQLYPVNDTSEFAFVLYDTTTVPRFKLKFGAPTFVAGYNTSCNGFNDGYINVAKNSDSLFSVSWMDINGNFISQQTDLYQIATEENLAAGTYIVEISDQLCGTSSDTVIIAEPNQIVADFHTAEDTLYLVDKNVDLLLLNDSQNASYFEWNLGSLGVYNTEDVLLTLSQPGLHDITLYAFQSNNCFDYTSKYVVVESTAKMDEYDLDFNLIQSDGSMRISGLDEPVHVMIVTLEGKTIYQDDHYQNETLIDLSNLPTQMIIVSIADKGQTKSKKCILK